MNITIWKRTLNYVRKADKSSWPYIYGVVLFVIFLIVGSRIYTPPPPPTEQDPVALQAKVDLNFEMAEMEPVPGARYDEVRNSWKERTFRVVSVRFQSNLAYKDIVKHYGRQLENRGWMYDAVRDYKSQDTSMAYSVTFYQKESYYAQEKERYYYAQGKGSRYYAKIAFRDGYYYLTFEWRTQGVVANILE